MGRALKFGICAILAVSGFNARPVLAQSASDDCQTASFPIYEASSGRRINGVVKSCSNGLYDVTPAPNRIKAGEMLFMAGGRFNANASLGANARNVFVRARPNHPYALKPNEPDAFVATYVSAQRGLQWSGVARTLPFVPSEVYYMDKMEGYPRYAYGILQTIQSRAADMRPLNKDSVIFSVDGFGFMSPDAWRGLMYHPAPGRYVEVMFFQRNENPKIFRRAFVPMFNRSSVSVEWNRITQSHAMFRGDSVLNDPNAVSMLRFGAAVLTLAAVYQLYYGSGLARSIDTPEWHDPMLDLYDK